MKQKALLVNVHGHAGKPNTARPAGGHRIAHYLRSEHDWDIEVIDFSRWWTLEELQTLFKHRYAQGAFKFVGFSHLFSIWDQHLEDFGVWIKKNYPDVILLSGAAVHPQFQSNCIDYYVRGFGEKAVVNLLEWLFSNGRRPVFMMIDTKNRKIIDANDQYPAFPMRSLMIKYENRDFLTPGETLGIEFARGCKFECDFCNFPILGVKGDYSRDADDAYEQLMDTYDRFGTKNYIVADETFNDRTEKITKFADVIEKLPFEPWFSAFIRADLLAARKKDREELARMNVRGQFYGIETFNHASGKSISKGMHPDKLKAGLLEAKDYIKSVGNGLYRGSMALIVGLPHETPETLRSTQQWLLDNWQGESFFAYTLEIAVSDLVNPSKFSLDYEKYGYRQMATKPLTEARADQTSPNMGTEHLVWENDIMNWYEADKITKEFIELNHSGKFNVNVFQIGSMIDIPEMKDKLAIPESMYIPGSPMLADFNVAANRHVRSYIDNKLSWSQ